MKSDLAPSPTHLRTVSAAARAAWPELAFDDADFLAFLEARPPRRAAASTTNAGDLLLAFACARGDAAAVRILEREYFARLGPTLPRDLPGEPSEIVQALRERMLVAERGAEVRIESYSGRGPLGAWLRVAAVRVALNLRRRTRREVAFDEERALVERAAGDLEIDDLKRRYRPEFRVAFSAGLRALVPRHRTLLRQYYIDGLTMDAIARLHQVHRITIVRWIDAARSALAAETRRELSARLRIDHRELESILRLIESQMDLSLRSFLGA